MVTESKARNSAYGNFGAGKLVVSARHSLRNSAIFSLGRRNVRHICAVYGSIRIRAYRYATVSYRDGFFDLCEGCGDQAEIASAR